MLNSTVAGEDLEAPARIVYSANEIRLSSTASLFMPDDMFRGNMKGGLVPVLNYTGPNLDADVASRQCHALREPSMVAPATAVLAKIAEAQQRWGSWPSLPTWEYRINAGINQVTSVVV